MELIDKIYNNTFDQFLNGINDDEKDFYAKGYKEYLRNEYSNTKIEEKMIPLYSEMEIFKWKDYSKEKKYSLIVFDEALDKLRRISYEGFNYIKQNKHVPYEVAILKIEEMKKLKSQVLECNAKIASELCSEGILDWLNSYEQTDKISFRHHRIK